ncbi:MAG TPA: histidine phosphatase family protein [Bryobacteraceae bacterium]|nr:histidine phosphatase family protein [Bryobacteraceae bacterium]
MRTTFLLIRHADNDHVGRAFAGRMPGVHLNDVGRAQAAALADRLEHAGIRAIYSSPLERATETIQPLAERLQLPVITRERLLEVAAGEWTGAAFASLDRDPQWRRFNSFRSSTRVAGGELMTEVQTRITIEMEELRVSHPDETVALVSHADVIRFTVAHYAGIPIDLAHRLEVRPASVSIIALDDDGATIVRLNDDGPIVTPGLTSRIPLADARGSEPLI